MALVLKKLEDSTEYTVVKGDTLASIAADKCAPEIGPDHIAMLNWGAVTSQEKARAMIETVGVQVSELPDVSGPYDLNGMPFDPDVGTDAVIRLPEKYKKPDLAYETQHTLKIKKATPANVVDVTALDKWFIPEEETCTIGWALEGDERYADKVSIDVYGSNYCAASAWNKNMGTYGDPAAMLEVPVWKKDIAGPKARQPASEDWTGECNATDGVLKPGARGARHINVAFSPYTAQMRYWKADGDKDARVILKPFWPTWDKNDVRVDDSFKLAWTWHKTGGNLKRGIVSILDGTGRTIWRRALAAGELSDGDHDVSWVDGKYADGMTNSDGGDSAIAKDMPYRVRIEANKGAYETEGLSIAAMHSEVRMYVHPQTHVRDLDPYVSNTDKPSLLISLADLNHKTAALTKAADGNEWLREQLALAGWHAGPICADGPNDQLKRAVADFQRSVPKVRPGGTGDYARLTVVGTGVADADTKAALESIDPRYLRAWFGMADATRNDYPLDGIAAGNDLRDPTKTMIVWIEDRYWYANLDWLTPPSGHAPTLWQYMNAHSTAPCPDRRTFNIGDAVTDLDTRDIERPWLPLQIEPILLGKADALDTVKDASAVDPAIAGKMRRAIGPIRVDWSFDEIDGAAIRVPEIDTTAYGSSSRTKPALEWAIDDLKVAHTRKDVTRDDTYFNAPENCGGIRPNKGTAATDYFKSAFGLDDDNHLRPWLATADPARETVATVVHDDLGENHTDADLFAKRVGRAGVYFTPSIMAGDGYQVRAQVRFEKTVGYDMPNAEILDKRYPVLPQAHSAKMRNWRKTSMRGYVQWAPTSNFAAGWAGMRDSYAMAHVHIINECGLSDAAISKTPTDIFPTAADANYRALVTRAVPNPSGKSNAAWIKVDNTHMWPWYHHGNLGADKAHINSANHRRDARKIYEDEISGDWIFYAASMGIELADYYEKKLGLMRGHVLTDFKTTDKVYYALYDCQTCGRSNLFLERAKAASKSRQNDCKHPGCGGQLLQRPIYAGHYTCNNAVVANRHPFVGYEDAMSGGDSVGNSCASCASTLIADTFTAADYACDTCNFAAPLETAIGGTNSVGANCARPDCAGKLEATADVVMETYACDHCNVDVELRNPAGGTRTGDAHACAIPGGPGALQPKVPVVTRIDFRAGDLTGKRKVEAWRQGLIRGLYDNLPSSALGLAVGHTVNFKSSIYEKYVCSACGNADTKHEDTIAGGKHIGTPHATCAVMPKGTWQRSAPAKVYDTTARLWAHEVGHNRYFQHAANAPGKSDAQHDSRSNPGVSSAAEATGKNWDRSCLMSYSSHYTDFDMENDAQCMCFRCILKNRGWKLAPTALPPSGTS